MTNNKKIHIFYFFKKVPVQPAYFKVREKWATNYTEK